MRLLTLCLCLLSQMPKFVAAEENEVIINSLSLSKMLQELCEDPRLRQQLQLTGTQVEKVVELVWDKNFENIDAENLTAQIRNILGEKQILDLKRFSLVMRCPMGISPFFDFEILEACEIDKLAIGEVAGQKSKLYLKQRRQFQIQAVTAFLGELSSSDKVLIAQFLGNKYMPGISVSAKPAAEAGHVPFLDPIWAIRGETSRTLLDPNSPLASQIGISDQQKLQITELDRRGPLKMYFGKLRDILTDDQIISLARIRNEMLILKDCSWPFRKPEIKDYLGLDEREAKELLAMAERESQKLSGQIATLDRQYFQEICEKIPAPGRLKIQKLFAGVW